MPRGSVAVGTSRQAHSGSGLSWVSPECRHGMAVLESRRCSAARMAACMTQGVRVAAKQPFINTLRPLPTMRAAAHRMRYTYERYRIDAWAFEGLERHSGAPLRLLFAG